MDAIAPLTPEDLSRLLVNIFQDIRQRRPELFRGGEPWRPGGMYELPNLLPRIVGAARLPPPHSPLQEGQRWTNLICPSCPHQTPCGYCAHRSRDRCALRGEAAQILATARGYFRRPLEHA